jgi:hypothetical protein
MSIFGGGQPQMSEAEEAQLIVMQTMQLKDGMKTYNKIVQKYVTPPRLLFPARKHVLTHSLGVDQLLQPLRHGLPCE